MSEQVLGRGDFGSLPRFEWVGDGLARARAGVQTNCAGVSEILVRFQLVEEAGFTGRTTPAAEPDDPEASHEGRHVPAHLVDPTLVEAVFDGARGALEQSGVDVGLELTLVEAMVHMVDARPQRFREAGAEAVRRWLADGRYLDCIRALAGALRVGFGRTGFGQVITPELAAYREALAFGREAAAHLPWLREHGAAGGRLYAAYLADALGLPEPTFEGLLDDQEAVMWLAPNSCTQVPTTVAEVARWHLAGEVEDTPAMVVPSVES